MPGGGLADPSALRVSLAAHANAKAKLQGTAFPICLHDGIPLIGRLASRGPCARVGACVQDCFSRCVESNRLFEAAFALLLTWGIVSGASALQKALPADIAALQADALLGAFQLETSLAEASARRGAARLPVEIQLQPWRPAECPGRF